MIENPPPLKPVEPEPKLPSFRLMLGLGILGFIVSVLLCIPLQSPMTFFAGAVGAFVSLFFKGYRGICAGYGLALGLVLLGTIIYCANHPFNV